MMIAHGYVRVSTNGQAESGLGLEAQVARISEACDRQGWTLARVWTDAETGKAGAHRPGLESALAAVEACPAGECALVVAKLDRLARSASDLYAYAQMSRDRGWRLVILDPEIDLGSPSGRLMFGMLAAFAEFERDLISQRTREALAAAKARGVRLGGRKPQIPENVAGEIVAMRDDGGSWAAIARWLNASAIPTVNGGAWHPYVVQKVYNRSTRDREVV